MPEMRNRESLFRLISIAFGVSFAIALVVAFEFGSRFVYFYQTRFTDPQAADFAKRTAVESGIPTQFSLNAHEPKKVFTAPITQDGFYQLNVEASNPVQEPGAVVIELLIDGTPVTSNTRLNNDKVDPVELITYAKKPSRELGLSFQLKPGLETRVTVSNPKLIAMPMLPLGALMEIKGLGEWTWSPAKLNARRERTVFQRGGTPSAADPAPRVFTLGGSTTHGMSVPPSESYPHYIQAALGKGSVYNYGVVGISSSSTNAFVKTVLPKHQPQVVVLHDGYNDLPIILKKADGKYQYMETGDTKPYNPYAGGAPISFFRYNFWSTRNRLVDNLALARGFFAHEGDVFLGYDYSKMAIKTGTEEDIYRENEIRMKQFIASELDTLKYALENNIKTVFVMEPNIIPNWAPRTTGFRDISTGDIQRRNHLIQQAALLKALEPHRQNPNLRIVDLRERLEKDYKIYYYDECHLLAPGNRIVGEEIAAAIADMFKTVAE